METKTDSTKEKIIEEKEELLDIIKQKQVLKQEIQDSIKEKKIVLKELNLKTRLQESQCKNSKCNKIFSSVRKGKKYCSEKCRQLHNAAQQYEKLRNSDEFKKMRNEKNKKYYEKNKETIKPKMREYGMKYFFRKRDEKKLENEKKLEKQAEIKKEEESNENQTSNN